MKILLNLVLSSVAVFAAAYVLPGVTVDGVAPALVAAVALGVVNSVLRPLLLILTLPINILTLGLFTLVIIGGLVQLVSWMVPGFHVASFWWALVFAFALWLINIFFAPLKK
ncbi:MAG TPA: hypothetical protein DDW67_10100 [Elusimicrobia bacterium]|jgi:putative membrane protein|nr:hypothetical protein [Elusimicrobiota bacterium]